MKPLPDNINTCFNQIKKLMNMNRKKVETIGYKFGLDLRNSNYKCSTSPSYSGGYTKIEAVVELARSVVDDPIRQEKLSNMIKGEEE